MLGTEGPEEEFGTMTRSSGEPERVPNGEGEVHGVSPCHSVRTNS